MAPKAVLPTLSQHHLSLHSTPGSLFQFSRRKKLIGQVWTTCPSLNQSLARGMEGAIGLALVMCSNPSFLEITFLEGGEAHLPDENQDLLQKIQ